MDFGPEKVRAAASIRLIKMNYDSSASFDKCGRHTAFGVQSGSVQSGRRTARKDQTQNQLTRQTPDLLVLRHKKGAKKETEQISNRLIIITR